VKRPGRIRRKRPLRTKPLRRTRQPPGWRIGIGPCVVCPAEGGECCGPVTGHHIISQQQLKRQGLGQFLWDRRNRLDVCWRRHEQHEKAVKRIPRRILPDQALAFADELGLTRLIERYYPDDDRPRS